MGPQSRLRGAEKAQCAYCRTLFREQERYARNHSRAAREYGQESEDSRHVAHKRCKRVETNSSADKESAVESRKPSRQGQ